MQQGRESGILRYCERRLGSIAAGSGNNSGNHHGIDLTGTLSQRSYHVKKQGTSDYKSFHTVMAKSFENPLLCPAGTEKLVTLACCTDDMKGSPAKLADASPRLSNFPPSNACNGKTEVVGNAACLLSVELLAKQKGERSAGPALDHPAAAAQQRHQRLSHLRGCRSVCTPLTYTFSAPAFSR